MVHERHPGVTRTMLAALKSSELESIQAIMVCARTFEGVVFESPSWAELAEGQAPGGAEEDDPSSQHALESHHHDHAVWPRLREHERATIGSQRGPLASTLFVSFPSAAGVAVHFFFLRAKKVEISASTTGDHRCR